MKNLGIYLTIPLVILALGVIFLLTRIVPQGWRLRLLALAAFMLAAMPLNGAADPPMHTCYKPAMVDPVTPDAGTATQALINTPEWVAFRAAYDYLLDYMAAGNFEGAQFSRLQEDLIKAEAALNSAVVNKGVSRTTMNAIFEGMDASSTGYERDNVGPTCYKMAMTPEIERKFALSGAVNRQVYIRRLILTNTIVAPETIRMTRESIFVEVSQYLKGADLEEYKTLMLDLLQVSD